MCRTISQSILPFPPTFPYNIAALQAITTQNLHNFYTVTVVPFSLIIQFDHHKLDNGEIDR